MKEIIKETVKYEKVYVSYDGKEFDNADWCRVWEKYNQLTMYDLLKDFIKSNDDFMDGLKQNIIEPWCRVVVCPHKIGEDDFYEIKTYLKMLDKEKSDTNSTYFCPILNNTKDYTLFTTVCDVDGYNVQFERVGSKKEIEDELIRIQRNLAFINQAKKK